MAELSLEIVEGPGAGRRFSVGEPLEIGRSRDLGIDLQDERVSRRHAKVTPIRGGIVVEDLGSRNGTFVNGNELYGPTQLLAGDQLLVGVTLFEVRSMDQIAARPSAVRSVPAAFAAPPGPDKGVSPPGAAAPGLAARERRPDYVPKQIASPEPKTELDPLLDVFTKGKARTAPIAIFVIAIIAILILLATR